MRWYALLLLVATAFQAAAAAAVPFNSICRKITSPRMETFTVTGNNRVRNSKASPTDVNLSKTSNSRTEQIMTFQVPKEASGKHCNLKWSVASTKESGLRAEGDAHVAIYQDGKTEPVAGAEFGDWVGVGDGRVHYSGRVTCRDTLRLRLELRDQGKVFLKQNDRNGFFLEYC